jgi:mannose-6-phosphate isomerase-like protein (cupin superfamily)
MASSRSERRPDAGAGILGGMETGVAFATIDPDGEDRFQRLRQELGVSTFGLNLLRLRPGAGGRIHRHDHQEEVYLVLEGTLTLVVEGEPRELRRGDLARVAPDVRRQLVNRHPGPLLLLALGGAIAHEGRDGHAYEAWDETGEGRRPQEVPLPDDVPVDG